MSLKLIHQENYSIAPIDPKVITENGESPTTIILAIAILISGLLGSVSKLIQIIIGAKNRH